MSLFEITSPLHAINPKVWNEGRSLHAKTARTIQLLLLGFWCKTVVVDPVQERILITKRYLWFLKSESAYRFSEVSHFDYGFSSLATSWSIFGEATDQVESYSVALVLHNRKEVPLLAFRGEGSIRTGMSGVLLHGDSFIDLQGDQGQKSLRYIDLIQDLTGKGLSKPSMYFNRSGLRPPKTRY